MDAIYTMFGENTRELAWFRKSRDDAERDVAVEGDSLADLNVTLNKVKCVMKCGAVVVDKTNAEPH